ncbi:MAG: hypothetical protein OXG64_05975 [Chloroflexi bacterium]|nr:hypothetical protein [Chloroflexota bacterium]
MTPSGPQASGTGNSVSRRDVARAAVVALLAGLVYLLSSGAHAYSVDEITNYASARALVETGSPDLAGEQPFPREQLLTLSHPSADRTTSRYGFLSWAAITPAYLAASWLDSQPPPPSQAFPQPSAVRPVAALLYGPVVAAALVGATFLLGRNLGLRPRSALAAALILAFASPLWVYAKGLANIPLAALLAVLALVPVTRPCPDARHWTAGGVLAGLAVVTRPEFVVFGGIGGVLSLMDWKRGHRTGLSHSLVYLAAWAAMAVPGVGLWNLYRTGGFLDVGYRSASILWQTERAYIGVFGSLASPSFGLLVFMPVAAVGLLGLLTKASHRPVWLAMLALVVMAAVGYGSFHDWSGGVSWGPRYLTSVTPFLALGVGAVLQMPSTTLAVRLATAGLAAWSLGLAALGVLFDYQTGWRNLWDHGARPEQVLWNPHFSLIGAHLRLARQWLDGLIGPDLYLVQRLGAWALVVLVIGLLSVLGLTLVIEGRLPWRNSNTGAPVLPE